MENLNSARHYSQFRYTPSDEEVRATYGHILSLFPDNFTETEYREEIALLMSHINVLLKEADSEKEPSGISNERWRIILETVKLKAALIREQRLHKLRIEKAKLDKLKIDVIPKEEFVNAITEIVSTIRDYIDIEMLPSFVDEMTEILQRVTKRPDTINITPRLSDVE